MHNTYVYIYIYVTCTHTHIYIYIDTKQTQYDIRSHHSTLHTHRLQWDTHTHTDTSYRKVEHFANTSWDPGKIPLPKRCDPKVRQLFVEPFVWKRDDHWQRPMDASARCFLALFGPWKACEASKFNCNNWYAKIVEHEIAEGLDFRPWLALILG